MLLDWLDRKALQQTPLPNFLYWRSGNEFQAKRASAQSDMEARIRPILVELYGRNVKRDPIFARIFRPLDPAFAFMTSEQQIRVRKLQLQHQLQLVKVMSAKTPMNLTLTSTAPPVQVVKLHDAYQAHLKDILGPAGLFEYLLRDSDLARQLRNSPVSFSEGEFRETYQVLLHLTAGEPGASTLLEARNNLRRILGNDKFVALWSARDPRFEAVRKAAENHGLQNGTIQSIFEILNEAQDQLIESAALSQSNPEQAMQEAKAAQARREQRLTSLLGDEIADDIVRSLEFNGLQFTRQLHKGVLNGQSAITE